MRFLDKVLEKISLGRVSGDEVVDWPEVEVDQFGGDPDPDKINGNGG